MNRHKSYHSLQFHDFCKNNNIVTFHILSHSSHLLQLLDIGCFGLLKKVYKKQVKDIIKNNINYIIKLEFLPVIKAAIKATFTLSNIKKGVKDAELVLLNSKVIFLKLNIWLQTLILLPID